MTIFRFLARRIQRHEVKAILLLTSLGLVLPALAAFTPASSPPTVWVAQDATAAMHCTTHTILQVTPPGATTPASRPCAAGTIMRLVATTEAAARANHHAFVMAPTGPAAQALLQRAHPNVGVQPSVICVTSAACGGGGGGGSAPCEQQTRWIAFNTGNVAVQGWYSSWGTSDCQAFKVYSIGLQQTWSRAEWWPFHWSVEWEDDNGGWVGQRLPSPTYLTRFPSYWVGGGGSVEDFHEYDGWSSDNFSVQFTPR